MSTTPETTDPDTTAAPAPTDDDTGPGANREAARYRRELRAAETERDALRGQLETMRRAEVARIATTGDTDAPKLIDPTDLFAPDHDLAELLDDDGHVDPERVRAVIVERTERRPHLRADLARPRAPRPNPAQGSSANNGWQRESQGWSDVLKGG